MCVSDFRHRIKPVNLSAIAHYKIIINFFVRLTILKKHSPKSYKFYKIRTHDSLRKKSAKLSKLVLLLFMKISEFCTFYQI